MVTLVGRGNYVPSRNKLARAGKRDRNIGTPAATAV